MKRPIVIDHQVLTIIVLLLTPLAVLRAASEPSASRDVGAPSTAEVVEGTITLPKKEAVDPLDGRWEGASIRVGDLRCEYAADPLGIDVPRPRFSWTLASEERGQVQTAYRILVASSLRKLSAGFIDKWDSGKVESARPINVPYEGPALSSGEICYWKVRCWDKAGKPSDYSGPAKFEMGLLRYADWKGMWIAADPRQQTPAAPLLRKEFEVPQRVKRARMYVSGLGWSELYLNGRKISDRVLDPGFTDYDKRVLYVTHDITERLRTGKNAVGALLGNGWFSPRWGHGPQLLFEMNIELEDGSRMSVKSDPTWKTAASPITRNGVRIGEDYDARLEQPGWSEVGFDEVGWTDAVVVPEPGGKLMSHLMPPIKVMETLEARSVSEPKPGIFVFDLGQFFGGWYRMRVRGPRDTRVTIKYSARLFKNGLVDPNHHPGVDSYILKGSAEGEWYEPRFSLHPMRYVEIEGYPGRPTVDDVVGRVVYNDCDLSGDFRCSNELLNRVHQNAVWTLKNELYGQPLDCIGREPFAAVAPESVAGTLYMRKHLPLFWTKWLADIKASQTDEGIIRFRVPDYRRHPRRMYAAYAGHYPLLVWYVYQYYDDRRLLEEHYPAMRRWLELMRSRARADNLLFEGVHGDHMLPGRRVGEDSRMSAETPRPLLWTGTYYRTAAILSRAAALLGKDDDAERYAALADAIREAVNNEWLDKKASHYATGSQTSNLFPLALGIVPEEHEEGVVNSIVENILVKYEGHLHTGNIGTNSMMEALTRRGHGDVLYQVATTRTYPGWGYMIEQGATSLWECWSRNPPGYHARAESMIMWAVIEEFFYGDLAGIKGPALYGPGFMPPGFRELHIEPFLADGLESAGASMETVRGTVTSRWRRSAKGLTLDVTIPVTSRAKIRIPKLGLADVALWEGGNLLFSQGRFVTGVDGVTEASDAGNVVRVEVGSGSYKFTLEPP